MKIDSTYINYYVLNNRDTFYFPGNSTVIQCNYLQNVDKDHNKCRIYIDQKPGNGYIEIVRYNKLEEEITTYQGTLVDGFFLSGIYTIKTIEEFPVITGQYVNNWKYGLWTNYYSSGQVSSIEKYIEGASYPVKMWEYNKAGELSGYGDEEMEIRDLMEKDNH